MKMKSRVMMLIPFAAFSVQADIVETVEDCEFVYSGSAQSPLLDENVLTLPFTFSWGGHSYHEVDLSEWGCLNFSDGYIWVADRVDMSAADAGMFISNDTHSVTIRWSGRNCFGESTILNAAITLYDDGHFAYTYGANDSVLGQGFDFQNDGYAWFGSSLYDTITNNKRITITDDGKPTPFKNENDVVWADVNGYFFENFGVKNSRYTSSDGDTIHIGTGSNDGGVCFLTVKGSGTITFKARGSYDGFYYGFNNDGGQGGYVRNSTDYKSYSMTITAGRNELHTIRWVTYAGSHLGGGWGDIKEIEWNGEPITYVASNGCGTIPETWAAQYPTFAEKFGNVFLGALMQKSGKKDAEGNSMLVWQDYLAGTDPTDESSRLAAHIAVSNGNPIVTWNPNLNTNGEVRAYKVWGAESLEDLNWEFPTNSLHRFFKVSVEMRGESK